jgi:hypothetical protein
MRWREKDFLFEAMDVIYREEKAAIHKKKIQKDSAEYNGFQMFDIFEADFPNELRRFLETRNNKLLCLLDLRLN